MSRWSRISLALNPGYKRGMNETLLGELRAWLIQAGLAGTPETDIVSGFCDRCVAAGLPLARALVLIDTLHPVHEGRLLRWNDGPAEAPLRKQIERGIRPDAFTLGRSDRQGSRAAEPLTAAAPDVAALHPGYRSHHGRPQRSA